MKANSKRKVFGDAVDNIKVSGIFEVRIPLFSN